MRLQILRPAIISIGLIGVVLALSACDTEPSQAASDTASRAASSPAATQPVSTASTGTLPIATAGLDSETASAEPSGDINVGAKLPPRVRGLLIQEMQAILAASQQIQAAIVQGQHETVAMKAQAIHDSFIMDQQMTAADRQALLAAVPHAFLERDEALHALSAQLAQAGRDRDTTQQLQQFSKIVQGCVGCHSRYATARFPGLETPRP